VRVFPFQSYLLREVALAGLRLRQLYNRTTWNGVDNVAKLIRGAQPHHTILILGSSRLQANLF
jgi:hypothetical protein